MDYRFAIFDSFRGVCHSTDPNSLFVRVRSPRISPSPFGHTASRGAPQRAFHCHSPRPDTVVSKPRHDRDARIRRRSTVGGRGQRVRRRHHRDGQSGGSTTGHGNLPHDFVRNRRPVPKCVPFRPDRQCGTNKISIIVICINKLFTRPLICISVLLVVAAFHSYLLKRYACTVELQTIYTGGRHCCIAFLLINSYLCNGSS